MNNRKEMHNRVKDFFEDRKLTKYSIFIILTFTTLYIIYSLIQNIGTVIPTIGSFFSWLLGLFMSFILGMVIAYIINPLVNFIARKTHLDRKKAGRGISVLIAFLIIIAVIAMILYGFLAMILGKLVIGSISDNYDTIVATIQSYIQSIQDWADNLPGNFISDGVRNLISSITKSITSSFSGSDVLGTVSGLVGGIVNLVLAIIFSIYMLLDTKYLVRMWNRLLDILIPTHKETLNNTLLEIDDVLVKFIKGIAIDATIIAILSSLGLTLAGIKFAVFLGLFAGVCNVIPYFGPFLGMVPAFLVGATTDGFMRAVIAVAILFVIQQLDSNFIYPKVVGGSTGLNAIYVLLAVTVGGGIGGLLGMVLAVPVAGVLKLFALKWTARRKAKLVAEGVVEAELFDDSPDDSPDDSQEDVSETSSAADDEDASDN